MKKMIGVILAAAMAFSLAACSSQGGSEPETAAPEGTQTAEETAGEEAPGEVGSLIDRAEEIYAGTWVDQADSSMILTIEPTADEGRFYILYTSAEETGTVDVYKMNADALADGGMYYQEGFYGIGTYGESGFELEEQYSDGSGTLFVWDDGTLVWAENDSDMNTTERTFVREGASNGGTGMQNPWTELTAEEAAQYINFAVPEGAENVLYRLMEAEGQEPLAEVQFDLDGRSFNMRVQRGVDADVDISGMYYDWTAQDGATVWGSLPGSAYRYIGEDETADLLTWYNEAIETSYALSVVAPSLDGFDIIAVANMMAPQ